MNTGQEFSRLYEDVSKSIAAAITEVADLKVEHKDGKQELSNMMERLRGIQARFDGELDLLEQHAEWEKFTIAFFGETNAGKSTIIESLRILFNEDSRQKLLQQNAQDIVKFELALSDHVNQVSEGLKSVYAEFAAEVIAIKKGAAVLSRMLQEESSARMKRKLWLFAIGGASLGVVVTGAFAMLVGV